jgi:TfoX/Sxy family transcriptional regulator of competence genes
VPMPKPDPQALQSFEALVAGRPGVTVKPMFGNFGAFAGGQMFAGVFGRAVFVRLSQADREKALALPGAELFAPMKGRPMKEYVVLPGVVLADRDKASAWVSRSLTYVSTLGSKRGQAKAPKGGSK